MKTAIRHLDERFRILKQLKTVSRPPKGWVRAVRDALGMTSAQLAARLGVSQPRVPEIENAEISGSISFKSLERAAQAMNCRLVYAFIPETTLADTLMRQASLVADRQLAQVDQTMNLEDQAVKDPKGRKDMRLELIRNLMLKPARIWDEE